MSSSEPHSLPSTSNTTRTRQKVPLPSGFGLMHWSRQAMKMPTTTQNKTKQITNSEIVKHNTRSDAWVILRGYVYDITDFLLHHPGGVDILDEILGKDCTKLFDEYHAFVNSDFILEK
ncbi:predicted protein [Naegleria gruberi]|uniref:Predicted protein n=1 Tax=Naegleria gruberi TaxID=5762 RepID=D2UXI5_NAEGR|nr:uncharacterized protein NAEGRDRAFT_61136 [Naegleria gruberi]EFC50638.1 predicted protein [Naegleria gruberi]|eukprot:XP_002683382.1 predicted protein [Naegleria gruberi strain NEG-M]